MFACYTKMFELFPCDPFEQVYWEAIRILQTEDIVAEYDPTSVLMDRPENYEDKEEREGVVIKPGQNPGIIGH